MIATMIITERDFLLAYTAAASLKHDTDTPWASKTVLSVEEKELL
jgi:hypothetical protein